MPKKKWLLFLGLPLLYFPDGECRPVAPVMVLLFLGLLTGRLSRLCLIWRARHDMCYEADQWNPFQLRTPPSPGGGFRNSPGSSLRAYIEDGFLTLPHFFMTFIEIVIVTDKHPNPHYPYPQPMVWEPLVS